MLSITIVRGQRNGFLFPIQDTIQLFAKNLLRAGAAIDDNIGKVLDYLDEAGLAENTLVGQAFVKDPDTTVGKLLAKSDARVIRYVRMEVGEGIEKKQENFADEVMAQVTGG